MPTRHAYGEYDQHHTDLATALDDLPLWSAPFALRLLSMVELRRGITAVDIGSGTGFPSVELAERLGPDGVVHAIEPWDLGRARTMQKLAVRGLTNVIAHDATAEALPLADGTVDIVVSNNGLNNVEDLDRALSECARVSRPGAQMVMTWNLPDTMREFYAVLSPVLGRALGSAEEADGRIREHIFEKRKPLAYMQARLEDAGFVINRVVEDEFALTFLDGSAMFDHFLIRSGFAGPWLALAEEQHRQVVFEEVEAALNGAARSGPLRLSVPFACLDARRR